LQDGIRVNAICPGYIDAGLAWGYFEAQVHLSMNARART
jgi:NAD(P)-dependent dehydrogenase (short-subunit alcohol dehydrogenase family)